MRQQRLRHKHPHHRQKEDGPRKEPRNQNGPWPKSQSHGNPLLKLAGVYADSRRAASETCDAGLLRPLFQQESPDRPSPL